MEEKGAKREAILIFFLVLAVVAIVCIGVYILRDSSENPENIVNNETLENVINKNTNDENKANENITNSDETTDTVNITEVNIITDIDTVTDKKIEDIAKNTLEEYLEIYPYENSSIGPMPNLLSKLGLETEENLALMHNEKSDKSEYIKSNTSYVKFKNALLQYVTEDYFSRFFSQYKDIDGYVAFCDCAGDGILIGVEKVELSSKNENQYIFDLVLKDLEIYDHYLNGEDYTEEDYLYNDKIVFEYVDERLVIAEFNDSIILEGVYAMENADVSYEFYKDGTVEYSTNMSIIKGTYLQCGEKELKITWEEETVWEESSNEPITKPINEEDTEKVTVIDEKTIIVEDEYEGEIYSNEFIKF